MEVWKVERLIY
jgi:dynactin-4